MGKLNIFAAKNNMFTTTIYIFAGKTESCLSNPCKNNATCINEGENFTCYCKEGFTGNLCQIGLYFLVDRYLVDYYYWPVNLISITLVLM